MAEQGEGFLFKGTEYYYARYRPGYPNALFDHLVKRFRLNGDGRLLDLGCGTGQLAIPLAPHFERVFALNPEEGMLSEGARLAKELGVRNIEWIRASSDDLLELKRHLGPLRLTTIGRAFHWMGREETLAYLYSMTEKEGGVAMIADSGAYEKTKGGWEQTIQEVIEKYLGPRRRAGSGYYVPPKERHEGIVSRSEFQDMEIFRLDHTRIWEIDQIIGHLYSTSYCSPVLLGEKRVPFEREIRSRLLALEPSGVFREEVSLQAILAWKRQ